MEIKGPTLPDTLSTSMCITPISFSRSTGRWKLSSTGSWGLFCSEENSSLPCPPCQPPCPSQFRPPSQTSCASSPSVLQGFGLVCKAGRLWIPNSQSVSESVSKVGLELLGQLKIFTLNFMNTMHLICYRLLVMKHDQRHTSACSTLDKTAFCTKRGRPPHVWHWEGRCHD